MAAYIPNSTMEEVVIKVLESAPVASAFDVYTALRCMAQELGYKTVIERLDDMEPPIPPVRPMEEAETPENLFVALMALRLQARGIFESWDDFVVSLLSDYPGLNNEASEIGVHFFATLAHLSGLHSKLLMLSNLTTEE